jgi:hypothetical protein
MFSHSNEVQTGEVSNTVAGGADPRWLSRTREREIARQQSVSERRQGANRTSSGVHRVNCRLAPPEASLPCARPPAFETAAQVTHTMLVKISQNSLFQPSLCASPLGIAKRGRSQNLPATGHTNHRARRQFVRGGNGLGAHKKNTTCGISKNISAGFERSVGSRKVQQRAVLLIVAEAVLASFGRWIVGLNPPRFSLRPCF